MKHPDTGDFGDAWGGIASVQLGLPIVWSQVLLPGVELPQVIEWMATRTDALVGLDATGRGSIHEGARADLAVFAPDEAFVVLPEHLHHKNAVTAYAENALAGVVRQTYLAGEVVSRFGAADRSSSQTPAAPRGRPVMR